MWSSYTKAHIYGVHENAEHKSAFARYLLYCVDIVSPGRRVPLGLVSGIVEMYDVHPQVELHSYFLSSCCFPSTWHPSNMASFNFCLRAVFLQLLSSCCFPSTWHPSNMASFLQLLSSCCFSSTLLSSCSFPSTLFSSYCFPLTFVFVLVSFNSFVFVLVSFNSFVFVLFSFNSFVFFLVSFNSARSEQFQVFRSDLGFWAPLCGVPVSGGMLSSHLLNIILLLLKAVLLVILVEPLQHGTSASNVLFCCHTRIAKQNEDWVCTH